MASPPPAGSELPASIPPMQAANAGPVPQWDTGLISVESERRDERRQYTSPIPLESEQRSYSSPPAGLGFNKQHPANASTANLSQYAVGAPDTSSSRTNSTYSGIPRLDYKLYSPPQFELSLDGTTLSSRSATALIENADALAAFLRTQAMVPPKPMIQVKGSRPTRVDFDIKLNLMSLLVPEDGRMRTNYIRCVSEGELAFRGSMKQDTMPIVGDGGLEEWCKLFVADAAETKSFVMSRTVTNLDTMYIDGQIRSLMSSIGYKGKLEITFPTTHSKIVVHTADKIHKIVTSFKTIFKPKAKYDVVQSVWPFATAKLGVEGRQFTVQSEESWWKEWRDPIKFAIATKRQGWVTNEDKLEALMEGKGKGVQPIDWDEME